MEEHLCLNLRLHLLLIMMAEPVSVYDIFIRCSNIQTQVFH